MEITFDKNINNNSETTSTISSVSYDIENYIYKNSTINEIKDAIDMSKSDNKFPKNLTFIDAHLDEVNGICASAFLDENTNKVIIGFAGTNKDTSLSHAVKDVIADLKIGFSVRNADDYYYKSTQKFIDKINDQYEISTYTGHSKGGHNAVVLGAHNNVDNIVVYNAALIYNNAAPSVRMFNFTERQMDIISKKGFKLWRYNSEDAIAFHFDYLKESQYISKNLESKNLKTLKKELKNYKGKITWFISNKDLLNTANMITGSTIVGERVVIDNESWHSMARFLDRDSQAVIIEKLLRLENIYFKTTSIKKHVDVTNKSMKKLNQLAVKFSQSGGISSNQRIMLDKTASLILVSGYQNIVRDTISDLTSDYKESIEKYNIIWQGTYENACLVGDRLSEYEILEALDNGGATKENMLTSPVQKIEDKLSELKKFETECVNLLEKIRDSVTEMIQRDNTLAQDFGVFYE
ncbi:hypothetical protein [Macrococcus armenti]|uniref:hypothetical protein n=1 Tax=Macrococcus armenti TaxID=2875764 RepID=UPI001CCB971C|nr:hypothetical protein [Macrococcus armenti]UBH08118.1 hypothetical protein LAU41_08820 [Macrococcus armenti]UBH10347.1 hypothetical protein LAU38_08730 [Macrococcus armenti]UBH14824.1 hypothetical protein LAU44_08600 [Macrococcus armenti]UBH17183.1 hypothetical protein LAU39_08630 [Macrococcus armenti]UBH19449.1 hypothetical protein LAU40_08610 [Macrococcus armenti]